MSTHYPERPKDPATDYPEQQHGLTLPLRLGLIGAATAFGSVFVADVLLILLLPTPLSVVLTLLHALLMGALAAAFGAALGGWVGYQRQQRFDRLTTVADAWLRGNLALRTGEAVKDEFGVLAERLDLLVEHLEEDEEDLDRLRESNTRLTDQVRALAVVEERNRLARELHDSVKQHLFSLAMTASAVRTHLDMIKNGGQKVTPELEEMVREIEAAAQAAQRETTRLIEDLRPAPLQERGLAAALNDYTLLFGAQEHLLVYLDVSCTDQPLPPLVTEALYRVAQEALHNVARHAQATRVDVQLQCIGSRVILTVDDNGIGFDPRHTRRGLGISSMQERLMSVGGRLQVKSTPGAGTTITAEVDVGTGTQVGEPQEQQGGIRPRTEAWAWLGQRLTIPVGQTWPWLPADQERHLRGPAVEPGTLILRRRRRLLGLLQSYVIWSEEQHQALIRLHPERNGVNWEMRGAAWGLRHIRGVGGRAVLMRNDQPLAAMQYRSQEPPAVTEVVYDDRLYLLTGPEGDKQETTLTDEAGQRVLTIDKAEVWCHRTLPLPLVAAAVARAVDESEVRQVAYANEHRTGGPYSDIDEREEALRVELRRELRATLRDVENKVPADVYEKLKALEAKITEILPEIDNLGGSDQDAYVIRQTIRDYLPTALADYRALPPEFAVKKPIQEGKTAHEHLLRQLDLLQKAIDDLADRLPRERAQDLLTHGRFLAGRFGGKKEERNSEN